MAKHHNIYSSHLYSEGNDSALDVEEIPAEFGDENLVDGRLVLQANFEKLFNKYPEILTFGEDVGGIGGVNQVMEGMQEKFGEIRVSDTGIRECTILGSGIGLAMRGLRPIAEIQYLDYLYYALQLMRDDLASLRYRSAGGQKAPVIIRTRGHRLEGIWHSGSPWEQLFTERMFVFLEIWSSCRNVQYSSKSRRTGTSNEVQRIAQEREHAYKRR